MSNKQTKSGWTAKQKLWLQNCLIIAIVCGIFLFFGYSVVKGVLDNHVETHYVDTQTVSDYMTGLSESDGEVTE